MTFSMWFGNTVRLLVSAGMMLMLTANASAEWKEKVLYSFQGGSDGSLPAGAVVLGNSGNLYGATTEGGSTCPSPGCGTLFEISPPAHDGGAWTETLLYDFNGTDGSYPDGSVIIDSGGNLYGTTAYGGSGTCILQGFNVGCGVVYELSPPMQKSGPWTYAVLYNFQGGADGLFPWGQLVFDKHGDLYGATQFGGGQGNTCNLYYGGNCGTVFKLSPPKQQGRAWKERILYSFAGGLDGANPYGGLVFDGKGRIYGATFSGGNKGCKGDGSIGCGTVFSLNPPTKKGGDWSERILYTFQGNTDGFSPFAGVILDAKAAVYGAAQGGVNGGGIVFRLKPAGSRAWKKTVMYGFSGGYSYGPTVAGFDKSGNLYGTTNVGPNNSFVGSVYRLRPPARNGGSWDFNLLYGFTGAPNGALVNAGLAFDNADRLYGTTTQGGTGACSGGCGTAFEVSP